MSHYKRLTFKSLVDPYDDDCEITEITEYKDKCYERDNFDWLKDLISNEVCDEPKYVYLTDDEFDKEMEEKVEGLGWKKVILLKVSV